MGEKPARTPITLHKCPALGDRPASGEREGTSLRGCTTQSQCPPDLGDQGLGPHVVPSFPDDPVRPAASSLAPTGDREQRSTGGLNPRSVAPGLRPHVFVGDPLLPQRQSAASGAKRGQARSPKPAGDLTHTRLRAAQRARWDMPHGAVSRQSWKGSRRLPDPKGPARVGPRPSEGVQAA